MTMLYFPLAFLAGLAISIQAGVNSQLALAGGGNTIAAAAYSFMSGAVVLTVIALLRGGFPMFLANLAAQPWWKLTGGFLGAGAIFCTVFLAPRIGLANLLALVIVGQLLSSLAIDHFGLIGAATRMVTPVKLIGAGIMIAGVLTVLFGDRLLPFMGRLHYNI